MEQSAIGPLQSRLRAAWRLSNLIRVVPVGLLCLVLYALQVRVFYAGQNGGVLWLVAVQIAAQDSLIWIALLPLVLLVYERVGPPVSWHALLWHLAAGIIAAAVHVAIDAVLNALWSGSIESAFVRFLIAQKFAPNLFFYAILVGGLALVDFHLRRAFHMRNESAASDASESRLILSDGNTTRRVRPADILAVEAAGNYVCVLLTDDSVVVRSTLRAMADRLAEWGIIRIHRSALVNPLAVERIETERHGDATVTLSSGRELAISRRFRADLERRLKAGPG